jgi:hypothetical protein
VTEILQLILFHLSTFFGAFFLFDNVAILLILWTSLGLFVFGAYRTIRQRGRGALVLTASPLLSLIAVPLVAYFRDEIPDADTLRLSLSGVHAVIFLAALIWGRRAWGSVLLMLPLITLFWISALFVVEPVLLKPAGH